MSHFVPKMRNRDDTQWPTPPGTWKQREDISHLATFADKLDVSKASKDTDLLNSVPTPWARLLLFENALFDNRHPSHHDIVRQWRGLLGVLALARPLGLKLDASSAELTIRLSEMRNSTVAKTFSDLRPEQLTGEDERKWDTFQMIAVDNQILGATSPRTLVFTGIAHQCPSSIPFQTLQGKLSDPFFYYKKYRDKTYLALLNHWLTSLLADVQADRDIRPLLGTIPKPEGATETSRFTRVKECLEEWQAQIKAELVGAPTINIDGDAPMIFGLQPYRNGIKGLPALVDRTPLKSDLLLKGRKDNVIVCFRPQDNSDKDSRLLDSAGNPIQNEALKIYDGWWHDADKPIPRPLDFLPQRLGVEVIDDPVEQLFEDYLIQVNLPKDSNSVYPLTVGNGESAKRYLFPFKSKVLDYLDAETIAANTRITGDNARRSIRVELQLPLINNRKIVAVRDYSFSSNVVVDPTTAELAAWPDFRSESWSQYFYFKNNLRDPEVDFKPISGELPRKYQTFSWYRTEQPVEAFVGSLEGKSGLLLVRYKNAKALDKYWKVSVDFGSTHTRAFSLPVEQVGDNNYKASETAKIEPISFSAHAQPLTLCGVNTLDNNFFPASGRLDPPTREELKSLLMTPVPLLVDEPNDWLPREGFVYMHWLFENQYDENRLKENIKWEENRTKYDLRAFLRCFLTMLQAEATHRGARIVSISRAFPSAFTATLEAQHKDEWDKLGLSMKLRIGEALSEAVATCRYLEGVQNAPVINNAISLDVGGSTTDIAIWAGKTTPEGKPRPELELQESVKMAAGIVGRYLQSPEAEGFLKEFEKKMRDYRQDQPKIDLSSFAGTRAGYALLFYNFLSFLELRQKQHGTQEMENLIEWVKVANDIEGEGNRVLISHLTLLFASLLYYVGLLARKANLLERHQNTYHLYFCGKGGTLIQWVNKFEALARRMFAAGLFGPEGRGDRPEPNVIVNMSRKPKEEVGRGLLAKSMREASQKDESIGLVDLKGHSVTVGETGYGELSWRDDLNAPALTQLALSIPKMEELKELQTFMAAFRDAKLVTTFDFNQIDPDLFIDNLKQRLFVRNRGEREEDTLVEPLFITEVKVLQEMVGKNDRLFD